MSDLRKQMYGAIVRLHPAEFREEFGQEMLLDFDEALPNSGFGALCLDGLISLGRQWVAALPVGARENSFAHPSLLAGQYVAISPGMPSFLELFRAAVLATLVYLALAFVLTAQHNRTPTQPGGLSTEPTSGAPSSSAGVALHHGAQQGSSARRTPMSSTPLAVGRRATNAAAQTEQAEPLLDPYWVASMKQKAIASTKEFAKTTLLPSIDLSVFLFLLLELWKRRPRVAKWVALATLTALAVATPATFGATHAQVMQANGPMPATPAPQLEVATIKPSDPAKQHLGLYWRQPDGFKLEGTTLRGMIVNAYGVQGSVKGLLQGGPAWMAADAFDLVVKVDPATTERWSKLPQQPVDEERRAVMRDLLADRFQLKLHREMREMPALLLTVGKDGSKLQTPVAEKSLQTGVPQSRINFPGRGHWDGHYALMSNLCRSLAGRPEMDGRPIVDKTGLTGQYDFTLRWAPFDPAPGSASMDSSEQQPSLFTALQEQLGLRLIPGKEPMEVLVVDSADKPSEN